jgi:hypothetical protein
MLEFGASPVLQRIDLLGLAAFVMLAGPGRWSADYELGRAEDLDPVAAAQALWALRVAAGVALIAVAFVEKLANPDLAPRAPGQAGRRPARRPAPGVDARDARRHAGGRGHPPLQPSPTRAAIRVRGQAAKPRDYVMA